MCCNLSPSLFRRSIPFSWFSWCLFCVCFLIVRKTMFLDTSSSVGSASFPGSLPAIFCLSSWFLVPGALEFARKRTFFFTHPSVTQDLKPQNIVLNEDGTPKILVLAIKWLTFLLYIVVANCIFGIWHDISGLFCMWTCGPKISQAHFESHDTSESGSSFKKSQVVAEAAVMIWKHCVVTVLLVLLLVLLHLLLLSWLWMLLWLCCGLLMLIPLWDLRPVTWPWSFICFWWSSLAFCLESVFFCFQCM